jgi:hypothetical protein
VIATTLIHLGPDPQPPPRAKRARSGGQFARFTGRIGSIRARRVVGDRSFAARDGGWQYDWPLCHSSPTFRVAPAAEVKVGLMAVGVSTPDGLDRLLTLQR